MRSLSQIALLSLLASFTLGSIAFADHLQYRAIDAQLSEISTSARDLRWDVALAPLRESDRRSWLREADDICNEISDLQRSVLRTRSPQHLCNEVDDLREAICEFRDELQGLGQPASYRYERGLSGSRFRCGVLNGGCVLPTNFISRLKTLDIQVASLHASIVGIGQREYGFTPRPQVPARPFAPPHPNTLPTASVAPPSLPAPAAPFAVPGPSARHEHRSRGNDTLRTVQWVLSQIGN